MKTLKIDLSRFVTKKYFRETLNITPSQMANWVNRSRKIKIQKFDSVGLELIDLDFISEFWTDYNFEYSKYFTRNRNRKIRLRRRELEIQKVKRVHSASG